MANAFLTTDWLAMDAVEHLTSKLVVAKYFNSDWSGQFKLKYPVADTIRVQYPDQGAIRNGLTFTPEALKTRYTTVAIDEPFGSDFELDSIEQVLSAPRGDDQFRKMHMIPRVDKIAQEIDSRCALYAYQHAASLVGVLGTNPASFDACSGAALEIMTQLGAPEADRAMLLPPAAARGLKAASLGQFNPSADISKMFRQGIIGTVDGFDVYNSMSLYRHTAGTWAGAVTITTAPANGATTLSLTCTTGDTFKKGDKIAIASVLPVHPMTKRAFGTATKTFTVTAAATGASSAATVSISPAIYYEGPHQNVDSQPAASAALTLWPGTPSPNGKTGTIGLAMQRNAFALVGVELDKLDVTICKVSRDPDSGIPIRFSHGSDFKESKKGNRYDTCIGFGEFYNDSCAVAIACA
jgi:hypothetical protein